MRVKITSGKSFPVWTLGHFVGATDANYSKLLQISRVVQLIDAGNDDRQFCVGHYSAGLYADKGGTGVDPNALTVLAEKGESADEFWSYVRTLRRPIIFFKTNPISSWRSEDVMPLYFGSDPAALKVSEASVVSPIHISFEGLAEFLRELFHGKEAERRREERHQAEMDLMAVELVGKKAQVAGEVLQLTQRIERARISDKYKNLIFSIVSNATNRQESLNERLEAEDRVDGRPGSRTPWARQAGTREKAEAVNPASVASEPTT